MIHIYRVLAVPLAKSIWPEGRIGPSSLQDAERAIRCGAQMIHSGKADKVLVTSSVKPRASTWSELWLMVQSAAQYGLSLEKNLYAEPVGHDTITQIEHAIYFAEERGFDEVVFISTNIHFLRVISTFSHPKIPLIVSHKFVCGIPRPTELITDCILLVAYPMMRLLGLDKKFNAWAKRRRESGKL